VQNLGTGQALTSFLPLPGGGFYDNYRDRKSPQGIRPISKSGLFYGSHDELEEEINAWRALLGVRDKLSVLWDNGAIRWQWARLQSVETPRASDAKGGWLPFTLTWISAAQNWRGVVYDEVDWTWGDDTWVWGDGTAAMGVGNQQFSLTVNNQSVTAAHNGNIDAPNLILRFAITGTWQDVTVVNQTTGQAIIIDRAASDTLPELEINTGARSIYAMSAPLYGTATRSLSRVSVTTVETHGYSTGDMVRIEDSVEYDGDYYPITVVDTTTFTALISPRTRAYGARPAYVRKLTDLYPVAGFNDIEEWMVMAPGNNSILISWNPFPTSVVMTAEFVEHYG
jgi:hypothetical protein